MFKPTKIVNRWLNAVQSSIKLPWVKVPQSLVQTRDQTLPAALTQKLSNAIQDLPVPEIQVQQIVEELKKTVRQWQDYDNMPNVLVVLTEPVQPTDGLLTAVLKHISQEHSKLEHLCVHRLDQWSERPLDHTCIEASAENAIATLVEEAETAETAKLIVIPSLERYFLRCVDGLEAIETVRHAIVEHSNCFWLVGCNRWAWHYLDKVCYLSAYLESSFQLPTLSALDLRHWLTPLDKIAKLPPFSPSAQPSQSTPSQDDQDTSLENLSDWRSQDEEDYFESIKKYTSGLAPVAASSWLHSLQYELVDPAAENVPQHPEGGEPLGDVKRGQIELPDIPALKADERFLLYAILLHGSLSSHHLALSLAEPGGKVQAELQSLRRQNLIEKKSSSWAVNPAYFPSLRRDLERNNFLLG